MKLLFAETFRLGDGLYAAAVLDALKKQTGAECHLITSELSSGLDFLWEKMGVQVHRFSFPWEQSGWQYRPVEIVRSLQRVKKTLHGSFKGVAGFNPRGSFMQNRVLRAAGARPMVSLDFANEASLLERFLGRDRRNIFDSRQCFLDQAAAALHLPALRIDPHFLTRFVSSDASAGTGVVFSPGASNPIKLWPRNYWIELAEKLVAEGLNVTVIDHPSSGIEPTRWPDGVRIFSGSVEELAAFIGGARLVVSTDSFVAHLASFMGVRSLILFGSQAPGFWIPRDSRPVFAEHMACRPCSQKRNRCRFGHSCMIHLFPHQVLDAALEEVR